jgi:iron complex outermembrane receptor protein
LILGGAVSKYDGNHFGKVIWTEKGVTATNKWYDLNADKNDFNIYGKWQQDITKALQFFADLQYRKVNYTINGFRDNPTLQVNNRYDFFNPKFGLSYHKNGWLAYTSYSIANKEPNRDDFEAGQQNQPKPEQLNDLEIGLEKRKNKSSFGLNFYYMKYKDQLVLTGKINDVGAYTRTNIDNSYRFGAELQGSSVLNKWLKAGANLSLGRNKIKNFKEYVDDYDNGDQKMISYNETDISFSPDVVGAATITLAPVTGLSFDLISKYVSKQYMDNTSNEQRRLNAYYTQDVRVIYSFNYRSLKNIDLTFQVNNVFNKKYEPNGYTFSYYYNNELATENYYFPMAGVNWMAGVNIRL